MTATPTSCTRQLQNLHMPTPAEKLAGLTLADGWKVVSPIAKSPSSTGGHFSHCYNVEKGDGSKAFLKALDYSSALQAPDPARALQALTAAYNFERDLLAKCRARNMDRVVRAVGDGSVIVGSDTVQYLILERAQGDIRAHLGMLSSFDLAWMLRCLHHIATGLKQLHAAGIAHQDLKPSNVLVFSGDTSKIADLGRASHRVDPSPFDAFYCAGDLSYAPPELLYRFTPSDWAERRFGCDVYLLGSMIVFLFTGISMTALLKAELDPSLSWGTWTGSFADVLPYLRDAFGRAVSVVERQMTSDALRGELLPLIRQLCDPDPAVRGEPRRGSAGSPLALDRMVTRLDLLARRAEYGLLKG